MKYNHGDPVFFSAGDSWRHGRVNFICETYMTITLAEKTVSGMACNIVVRWEDVADNVISLYDIDTNMIRTNKKQDEDDSE